MLLTGIQAAVEGAVGIRHRDVATDLIPQLAANFVFEIDELLVTGADSALQRRFPVAERMQNIQRRLQRIIAGFEQNCLFCSSLSAGP